MLLVSGYCVLEFTNNTLTIQFINTPIECGRGLTAHNFSCRLGESRRTIEQKTGCKENSAGDCVDLLHAITFDLSILIAYETFVFPPLVSVGPF